MFLFFSSRLSLTRSYSFIQSLNRKKKHRGQGSVTTKQKNLKALLCQKRENKEKEREVEQVEVEVEKRRKLSDENSHKKTSLDRAAFCSFLSPPLSLALSLSHYFVRHAGRRE